MNEFVFKRNELLAQKTIKGLESRNMSGYYAADKAEALRLALSLIPEGASVTMGGAASAVEIGLVEAVKQGNYNFIDRSAFADSVAILICLRLLMLLLVWEAVLRLRVRKLLSRQLLTATTSSTKLILLKML